MPPLTDQVVLITGCSSGIGRALSKELSGRGHRVFATARKADAIADLQQDGAQTLPLDVTNPASIELAVATVAERAGRIDILVNNAGFNLVGPLAEIPLDEFRRELETNVTGPLALAQEVFPHMARRGRGRIVNVGSVVGILPTPYAGAYCASKSALHMLSRVLRIEAAPFGIDVILVQPGAIRSNLGQNALTGTERYGEANSLYRGAYRQIRRRATLAQRRPTSAETFAKKLADAIVKERPPRLVRLGSGATALPALEGAVPEKILDRALARVFGLTKLPPDAGTEPGGSVEDHIDH